MGNTNSNPAVEDGNGGAITDGDNRSSEDMGGEFS